MVWYVDKILDFLNEFCYTVKYAGKKIKGNIKNITRILFSG